MRKAAISGFVFAIFGLISSAQAALQCPVGLDFPMDLMACSDAQLTALDDELDNVRQRSLRIQVSPDGPAFRRLVEKQCNIPTFLDAAHALGSRSCAVSQYTREIRRLAEIGGHVERRLHARPKGVVPSGNAYFTVLHSYETAGDAREDFALLQNHFPFEAFALYPPHGSNERWSIVFASYVTEAQAIAARNLALALSISPEVTVLHIDESLRSAEWLPSASTEATAEPSARIDDGSASRSADLSARVAMWRHYAELCTLEKTIWQGATPASPDNFPTKDDAGTPANPQACDDGDMGLFNGMLCAAGETQGCLAVKNAQSDNGQWWRSPALKTRHTDDPDSPNINSDQLLGVLLYVLQENDSAAFRRWLEWVQTTGSAYRLCSVDTDNCTFKPVDCPLIVVTAFALKVQNAALSVCSSASILGIPSPESFVNRYADAVNAYNEVRSNYDKIRQAVADLQKVLNMSGVPDNPLPPLPAIANSAAKFEDLKARSQKILDLIALPDPAGFAAAYIAASSLVTLNAAVAGATLSAPQAAQAHHLAATAILVLKKFRMPDPALTVAAAKLALQGTDNPYFEFLARGQTSRMHDLVMNECVYDPAAHQPKFQWSWERDVSADAAKQTMLWDCIFIADLLQGGIPKMKAKLPGDPSNLLADIQAEWQNLQIAASEAEQVVKEVLDQKAQVQDAANALSQQLDYLKKVAEAAAKGALPQFDGPKVTIPVTPPGTPAGGATVHVDVSKGDVGVSIGGTCIGHC
jgi:hypothetical protein